jgi:hypothetical protein
LSAIDKKREDTHSKNTKEREEEERDTLYVHALWALANDSAARRRRRRERAGITRFCNAAIIMDFGQSGQAIISKPNG